jgi:hypothetical protein
VRKCDSNCKPRPRRTYARASPFLRQMITDIFCRSIREYRFAEMIVLAASFRFLSKTANDRKSFIQRGSPASEMVDRSGTPHTKRPVAASVILLLTSSKRSSTSVSAIFRSYMRFFFRARERARQTQHAKRKFIFFVHSSSSPSFLEIGIKVKSCVIMNWFCHCVVK